MDGKFMFVPTSYKDQREKELIYAACKAHVSRQTAHKRRPQKQIRTKSVRRSTFDVTVRDPSSPFAETPKKDVNDMLNAQQIPVAWLPLCLYSSGFTHRLGSMHRDNISPELIQAISFTRFHLARSWSPTFMPRLVSGSMNNATFEHVQAQRATQWMWQLWTSDAALFWSVVASVMPIMISHLPAVQKSNAHKLALELKEESFNGLQHMLHRDSTNSVGNLLVIAYQVKSLFREACASGDTEAASYHSQMLAQLARKLVESSPTIEYHRIALWGDALPSLLQLRRPIVDFRVELSQIIDNIWAVAETLLPDTRMVNFELPVCVLNYTLREAFFHLKKAIYILNVSMVTTPDQQLGRVELLFQWLTTKAEHHICRILNLYHDLTEHTDTTESLQKLSEGERQVQRALALALLFAYQKSFFDICQDGEIDINDSAHVVLPDMRRTLHCVETKCSKSEQLFYQDSIFWITMVGAWAERHLTVPVHNGNTSSNPTEAEDHCFKARLSRYAGLSRFNSWSKAKKVLSTFAWSDNWGPQAGKWYGEIARSEKTSKSVIAIEAT